jgi:hypothetical protein
LCETTNIVPTLKIQFGEAWLLWDLGIINIYGNGGDVGDWDSGGKLNYNVFHGHSQI